jgi:hypothetical protein
MLSGFAKDLKILDKALVLECIEEIRLPGEATLQTSEGLKQSRQQVIEVLQQSNIQVSDVVRQPRSIESGIAEPPQLQTSRVENRPNRMNHPWVHSMIALLIMSVIIVLGIMIPTETTHLISGAN